MDGLWSQGNVTFALFRQLIVVLAEEFIYLSHGKVQKKRTVIRERISAMARGGAEARRGSGFSVALYPNPGFGNGMRRT